MTFPPMPKTGIRLHTRVVLTAQRGNLTHQEDFGIPWQCDHIAALSHPNVKAREAELTASGWEIRNITFHDC